MKKILFILIIIFFLACEEKTPLIKTNQIVPPELMEEIYFDLLLMKIIRNSNYVATKNNPYFVDKYILKKYGIDSLKLIQNQTYYAQKPKLMKRTFENIQIRILLAMDSLDNLIKLEKIN